jgi:SOS response regulatory protein OraA/RecX
VENTTKRQAIEMDKEQLKKRIVDLLSKRDMSVHELAQELGVSNRELPLPEMEVSDIEYSDGKWRLRKKP